MAAGGVEDTQPLPWDLGPERLPAAVGRGRPAARLGSSGGQVSRAPLRASRWSQVPGARATPGSAERPWCRGDSSVSPSALGGARILRRRSRRGPGYEELEGSRTSRCPSWVLTLPLPQPPASRVRLTRAGARPPAVLSLAKKRVSVPAFAPPPFRPCSPPGATCAEPEARLRLRIAPGFVRMRLGLNCHQLKEAVAATGRLFFQ